MSRSIRRSGALWWALGAASLIGGDAVAQCGPGGHRSRVKAKAVAESLLVSGSWLVHHHRDPGLIILHVDREAASYDSAHVPGARLLLTREFTIDRDNLFTELPPVEQLERLLESHGVGDQGRIVITGDLLAATRLWFTLDYLGLGDRSALLDGGLEAWSAAGGTVTTARPPSAPAGRLTVRLERDAIATTEWLRSRLADSRVAIIDVRAPDEYRGEVEEKGVPRPGHIPGSLNLEWTNTLEDGVFKRPGTLRALLEEAGAPAGAELVGVCRVGSRASLLYFVGRYLGVPSRVYDGSMNEWSSRPDLPVVKGAAPR